MNKIFKLIILMVLASAFNSLIALGAGYDTTKEYVVTWDAADMPTGTFKEYNGLSCVGSLIVTDNSRTYNNKLYSKTIKTNGSTKVNSNYIPEQRAFKFTTAQPCYVTILAYGTSTGTTEQPVYLSKSGSIVETLNLRHSKLTSNTLFLEEANTYYLYCQTGSFGVCYMQLHMIPNDINGDGLADKDDITTLYQMKNDSAEFNDVLLDFADSNSDGVINDIDITFISKKVENEGNYVPSYYSDKTWTMDNYKSGTSFSTETDLDGMLVLPSSTGYSISISSGGGKYYSGVKFENFLDTDGGVNLDNNNFAKGRAVKVFTSEPCYLTVLFRVNDDDCNLTVSTKDGIYSKSDVVPSSKQSGTIIQRANVYLDKPNEYSIGSANSGLKIYEVRLSKKARPIIEDSTERIWNFNDDKFTELKDSIGYVRTQTEIDGLTFNTGVEAKRDSSNNVIKGEPFKDYILIPQTTNFLKSNSISFEVDGPSDIYVVGKSNDGKSIRKIALYYEKTGETVTADTISENGYRFSYKGGAGKVYLYAMDGRIRLYSVAVQSTKRDYYNAYPNETIWDFSDNDLQRAIDSNTDYNGMSIFATEKVPVTINSNSPTSAEGFEYFNALNLTTAGNNEYMSVAFDVPKNSYVYVTARVPGSNSTRPLIVTNKYSCDLETGLQQSYIGVTGDDVKVYRFKYTGDGDKIYLRSGNSQIRIYQIAVKRITKNKYDEVNQGFDHLTTGTKYTQQAFGNLNLFTYSDWPASVVSAPTGTYNNALRLHVDQFNNAGLLYFNMSNCDVTNSGKNRTITITAKGNGKKLYLANKYGYVYTSFDLIDTAQDYSYTYTECDETLYLYSYGGGGTIDVYHVSSNNSSYTDTSGSNVMTLRCVGGNQYMVHFTCENISALKDYIYSINYDGNLLQLRDITFGNDIEKYENDSIVNYSMGKASFELNNCNQTNWSGIIATINFRAIGSGTSEISFDVTNKG